MPPPPIDEGGMATAAPEPLPLPLAVPPLSVSPSAMEPSGFSNTKRSDMLPGTSFKERERCGTYVGLEFTVLIGREETPYVTITVEISDT